jgi:hypothetical protein
METVADWSNGLEADFGDEGIAKPVHRLDKCLNRDEDYVEK